MLLSMESGLGKTWTTVNYFC